jgi:hypothetical protein
MKGFQESRVLGFKLTLEKSTTSVLDPLDPRTLEPYGVYV